VADLCFPESEAAAIADERECFRRWTRIEAVVKARGVGLNGMGVEPGGEWTIVEIDAGLDYSAAVALPRADVAVVQEEWGGAE